MAVVTKKCHYSNTLKFYNFISTLAVSMWMNVPMPMEVAMIFVSILPDHIHALAVPDLCFLWTENNVKTSTNVPKQEIRAMEENVLIHPVVIPVYVPEDL